ncbi:MAG: aldehyde dehydrogenase [Chroococcidiopsidaceae cyanobacterium CP_BM_ER_R8_30]|nr:aldehyde dehydrogenase [Chroococcidiopsidaceae cyanobacterium CP_BM_ER_R8_30]
MSRWGDGENAADIVQQQRDFFCTGVTKDVAFRVAQLRTLKRAIAEHQSDIVDALKRDLNKPEFEAYGTELIVFREIDYAIKHIKSWTKPKPAQIPIEQFPARAKIYPEPLGVVLIIGAWNYPFQLMISPSVGAIAAGNCAVLKPSELAPHTSHLVADIVQKHFNPAYITVIEGDVETSQQILGQKFDHIFFTGSEPIGKIVMAAAAKNLTPVTLELGGKSPCIVDADINIEYTARRIAWGKFLNAGQTCLAPDYLLVNRAVKKELLNSLKKHIREFYGDHPATSPDYARIINQKHFNRLVGLLQAGEMITGGETDAASCYIAPTIIDRVSWEEPVMQEEIFGPILPVVEYAEITEAIATVNARPKPLTLYFFSRNQKLQERVLQETSSGSITINDTIMQAIVPSLPFGGVGNSGIGSYHGKASFDTFSHHKSVLKKSFLFDPNIRYAPYKGKLPLLKRIFGLN